MGKGRRLPKAGLPTGKPAGVNKAAKPGGIVHYVKQRVHEIVRSLSFRKEVEDSSAATQVRLSAVARRLRYLDS